MERPFFAGNPLHHHPSRLIDQNAHGFPLFLLICLLFRKGEKEFIVKMGWRG
jgi:hypothetical protein